jgi:hypothetical protein
LESARRTRRRSAAGATEPARRAHAEPAAAEGAIDLDPDWHRSSLQITAGGRSRRGKDWPCGTGPATAKLLQPEEKTDLLDEGAATETFFQKGAGGSDG